MPLRPITEVAHEFGVSRDTIERAIGRGEVAKYRRRGDRRTFVDLEQVRNALGFHRVSGPEPGEEPHSES
ncbi:MAG: helix-turn-helix transcriptional regulator [Candidatus Dormibacteraceae bacterium]